MTFGLVHGGAHGAWCWERLVPELERRGARAIAMDLPCEDEEAGAREYAEAVVLALEAEAEPVVLVGHSLAGLVIPLVPTLRPVALLIFIAALLPVPGQSLREQQASEPQMSFPYSGGRAGLKGRFYQHCSPQRAESAFARLRQQALKPYTEVTPLRAWPSCRHEYIVCGDDRATNPTWARRAARERLGVEPVELAGSDHSPFLSCPERLAPLLLQLAGAREEEGR